MIPRKYLTLAAVCVAVLAVNMSTTIVNIALPSLAVELDASTKELLWIVDGYNLSFAALVLAAGSMSDKFGRRPALLLGLTGFAVASAAGGLVDSSSWLVVTRFAAGVCAAVIFPTTLSVISNAFLARRERAMALGVWGAATGVGVAIGPVAGGWLLENFDWQSVFWAMVPVAGVALVLVIAFVPESRDPDVPRLDVPGLVVSTVLLGLMVWTIIEAPEAGWTSAQTLTGFGLSLLALLLFIRVELAADHPMLDVALFGDRRFSAAAAAITVSYFALFGFIFLVTQFFQLIRDYSPFGTGLRFLPVAASIAVASILGGYLAPRLGSKLVVTAGMCLLGASFLWISTMPADASYPTTIVGQMLLMGGGLGLISTPATESIMQVLPPARAGVGSAVNDATREFGGTLGVAVIGSIFSSVYAAKLVTAGGDLLAGGQLHAAKESVSVGAALADQIPGLGPVVQEAFMDGFSTSCLIVGIMCVAGAVFTLLALPGNRRAAPETPEAPVGDLHDAGA